MVLLMIQRVLLPHLVNSASRFCFPLTSPLVVVVDVYINVKSIKKYLHAARMQRV